MTGPCLCSRRSSRQECKSFSATQKSKQSRRLTSSKRFTKRSARVQARKASAMPSPAIHVPSPSPLSLSQRTERTRCTQSRNKHPSPYPKPPIQQKLQHNVKTLIQTPTQRQNIPRSSRKLQPKHYMSVAVGQQPGCSDERKGNWATRERHSEPREGGSFREGKLGARATGG